MASYGRYICMTHFEGVEGGGCVCEKCVKLFQCLASSFYKDVYSSTLQSIVSFQQKKKKTVQKMDKSQILPGLAWL